MGGTDADTASSNDQRVRLHTTPQYEDGKSIVDLDGKRTSGEREELGLEPALQKELDGLLAELDHLAAQVPLDAPWTASQAEEFDNITVEEWFDAHTKNKAMHRFFQMLARTYHAADTKQMSFLFFLFYLHTCDTFESLVGIKNAAQAYRVLGGLHGVAAKLADELGQVIVLETPVQAISQDASGVVVHSQKDRWHADYAIVAVPLPLSVRITYDPPLPPHPDALAQRMPMGSVIKYWVAYDRPFWREHGWSGITLSDLPPSAGCYDCTPPQGKPGLLVGFIEANNALRWTGRPREERQKLIVGRIVDWFGPEAANPNRLRGQGLARRTVEPRMLRGLDRTRSIDNCREGDSRADWANPLGGDGDFTEMDGLCRGCHSFRRACRGGSIGQLQTKVR